jgi:spermidine/putrescine transport system permease protein
MRPRHPLRLGFIIFLTPVLLWLLSLIVIPHIDLLIASFQAENDQGKMVFSLENYKNFFNDSVYWYTFVRTAFYSILVTVLTFLFTFPLAFYITKIASRRVGGFLSMLLLLPFWVGELVAIYGWMILLRKSGIINYFLEGMGLIHKPLPLLYNDFSMVLGLVYMSMLFMVVPLISALESLDDSLIEAASDLGASKLTIIRKIVIPYAAPGITSGAIVVFMLALGDYLSPNLLGGKNSLWFTEQIYNEFIASFNWNQGAAFGFLLLALSSFIVWLGLRLSHQRLDKAVGS